MQAIDFILPSLKGFRNETVSKEGVIVLLRYSDLETLKLQPCIPKIVPTGICLKDTITAFQLRLEGYSLAWEKDVMFEIEDYEKGRPLKVRITNNTSKPLLLFPKCFLSYLHVNVK